MITKSKTQRRRNRFKFDPSNRPAGTFASAVNTISANKWAVAFSVPVVVKALPADWKVNGASPTAMTIVDSQHLLLTFAVNVAAGQTFIIPAASANVRTSNGGYVAAATGTF